MSKVRAVLLAVLATVGMVACSTAFAAIQWQGSMDDARRNAGAFMVSPQGKVSGLIYSLDPVATGWKLNRAGTALQQQPFPLTQGPYSVLRPASQYGITSSPSKAAVIDVPVSIPVPGKSSTVPGRIIEPVAKSTLAKSIVKAVPVIGTAYQIGELLDELGMLFRNGEWFLEQQPDPNQYPQSDGNQYGVYFWGGQWAPLPHGLTKEGACKWWGTVVDSGNYASSFYLSGNQCVRTAPLYQTFDIVSRPLSGCPPGHFWNGSSCVPSLPPAEVPITEQQASEKVESDASDDRLISIINGLPPDPRVIDVIAREVQDDPADEEMRWPSGTPTIQIGDPVTTTTTHPDGSTVTQTTTTTATVQGDQVSFTTNTTTTTYSPTGQPTGTTTTITTPTNPSNPNSPQQEDIECGLPGTPPCKIDETGTLAPPDPDGESVFNGLLPQCIQSDWKTCFPELPSINWSFSLPSGCSPIPVPFGRFGFTEVNICPWQGMIHDIMSMLWAAAGLFGAIGILSGRRNSEA